MNPILTVDDLSVSFPTGKGRKLDVISHLNLTVYPGEILAVAGSSGSGKSLLASAILGILPDNAILGGTTTFDGEPLTEQRKAKLRGADMALVSQSVAYLDPLMKVGSQVRKGEKCRALFEKLQLPRKTEKLYPFELSGGMARRVLVSTAILGNARLVIADEPTPGMSLEQARTALRLFRDMADRGCSVILITHDIDLAFDFADRIAVFYAGSILETAPGACFRQGPEKLLHPYSRALWRALPQNGFTPIDGIQPYAGNLPKGCLFSPRCPYADETCRCQVPPVVTAGESEVRCFHGTEG